MWACPLRPRAHQQPRAAEGVRAHRDVLELQLTDYQHGCRRGVRVEASREDSMQCKEREGRRADLDEEASDGHDHVQPLHEVNPLVARPVHRWVADPVIRGDALFRQTNCSVVLVRFRPSNFLLTITQLVQILMAATDRIW